MFRTILTVLIFSMFSIHALKYKFSNSSDLPKRSDLTIYLRSLRKILDFCTYYKYDLDLNFEFGLFLVNVNLKSALKKKKNTLPRPLLIDLTSIIEENDALIEFFNNMVKNNTNRRDEVTKIIYSLFSNETSWINRIGKVETSLIPLSDTMRPSQYEKEAITITEYLNFVYDFEQWVPKPGLSDYCMVSLASNRESSLSTNRKCALQQRCHDMLLNGTNFGYALSHRLLLLIIAGHSRGCSIISGNIDRKLSKKFCRTAYDEAKFISTRKYRIIDLLLEFMVLCGLEGFADFLRHDWLTDSIRFQTQYGCFGVTLPKHSLMNTTTFLRPSNTWTFAKKMDHEILGGICNGHVTAVAAGTLSVAIRYILEKFY